MRTIERGDRVVAIYTTETAIVGTVESMPGDTGDMIYLTDDDKITWALNPQCMTFVGLRKEQPRHQ